MQSDGMTALSAATVGIAAAGALLAMRNFDGDAARIRLAIVFTLFAGVALLPLVIAFARIAYEFYLPLLLPMFLTLSPAIYLYVRARTSPQEQSLPDWRHRIMPFAGLVVAIGFWLLPSGSRSAMLVDGVMPPGVLPIVLAMSTFILISIWSVVSFFYLVAILKNLRSFRSSLKDLYSNTDQRELHWIDWLMGFLSVLWASVALTMLSDNFGPGLIISGEIVLAITAGLLLFLMAFSITPSPVKEERIAPADLLPVETPKEKYTKSALSQEAADSLAKRIDAAMRDGDLYLDPNLSLQKLSAHVRAIPNMVSQTLNERMDSNFFDYVAFWRIEAAKQKLKDTDASVVQIAVDVGFNSRSTFYKAFKKNTDMTPKAFRETTISESRLNEDDTS